MRVRWVRCRWDWPGAAACVLDLEGVIVDGVVARPLLEELLGEVVAALRRYDWRGAQPPQLLAGETGPDAKVRGAAYLALHSGFAAAHDLFLKAARS